MWFNEDRDMCVRMRVPETFVSNRVLLSDILPYSSRRRIGGSSLKLYRLFNLLVRKT